MWYEVEARDFPGGPVVKNPPSNAGDKGSIPGWWTKVPHGTGQLSLCATTREARMLQLLSPGTYNLCSPAGEALAPQLAETHVPQKRPSTVKN